MTSDEFVKKFELFIDAPGAIPKMRELALRLAFSGRLSGHKEDETGQPVGWRIETIRSICRSISPGFACSKSHQTADGHVHLRTHNISTLGSLNFDLLVRIDRDKVDESKSLVRRGDVLFNNTNSQELVGKTALVDDDYPYAFSNHVTRLRVKDGVDPAFVALYLTHLRNSGHFARICTRWINQAAINTDTLKRQLVPVPPFAEQERIVAKVDELMALCNRLEAQQKERETRHAALTHASLSRFADAPTRPNLEFLFHESYSVTASDLRNSILTLATQGRLVWQNPDDESVDVVLGRIDRVPKNVRGKIGYTTPLRELKGDEGPFQLPNSWRWVRLGDVANIKHGFAFSSECFTDEPTPFVLTTPGNFYERGGFRDRGPRTKYYRGNVDPEFVFKPGDLIIPMTEQAAGLLGSAAFIPDDGRTYIHNQRLGRFQFHDSAVMPQFAFWYFNSEYFRSELARTCTGMKVRHTSPARVLQVLYPLAPFAEQRRIVAKVDQLMTLVDELESQLAASRETGARLLDAIVAELTA
jgi:type I restriction enzyme S subunit